MESVVKALAEAFMAENPDVTVNYSGTGSGTGIESATAGTCDIGLSSRALKEEETAAGAVSNVVALDGVAVIVNPANTVEDLTVEQIAQIFKGEITNWSQLGGADLEIAVYGREAGSCLLYTSRGRLSSPSWRGSQQSSGCRWWHERWSSGLQRYRSCR